MAVYLQFVEVVESARIQLIDVDINTACLPEGVVINQVGKRLGCPHATHMRGPHAWSFTYSESHKGARTALHDLCVGMCGCIVASAEYNWPISFNGDLAACINVDICYAGQSAQTK